MFRTWICGRLGSRDPWQRRTTMNDQPTIPQHAPTLTRRTLLAGAGAAAVGAVGLPVARRIWAEKQPVFLAAGQRYEIAGLQATIAAGLAAVGFDLAALRGRKVLLKPNLVE